MNDIKWERRRTMPVPLSSLSELVMVMECNPHSEMELVPLFGVSPPDAPLTDRSPWVVFESGEQGRAFLGDPAFCPPGRKWRFWFGSGPPGTFERFGGVEQWQKLGIGEEQ